MTKSFKKSVPSVFVSYARNGSSTKANALDMRPMQERAYEKREQYPHQVAAGVGQEPRADANSIFNSKFNGKFNGVRL